MSNVNRYSRQEILPIIPNNFNQISRNKKLIIVGCGGIGSPLAELLVRGGFLNLVLIDNDIIDDTNLSRQIYFEKDIGKFKSNVLKEYLININKKAKIKSINDLLDETNIDKYCKESDLIIDASDNFEIRKIINDYCEINQKDWLYNGAIKTEIISYLFKGKEKKFNLIFPKKIKNEKCCEVGVLPSTTFISAGIAYTQILKYFLNIKDNKLIKLNIWTNKLFEIKI